MFSRPEGIRGHRARYGGWDRARSEDGSRTSVTMFLCSRFWGNEIQCMFGDRSDGTSCAQGCLGESRSQGAS